MQPSVFLVALSALMTSLSGSVGPTWLTDYNAARQRGRDEQKPLCVMIGSGRNGWEAVSNDGSLDNASRHVLAGKYVCLYVDTEHIAGQKLAAQFEISGPGLVLSDGTGELQAFRYQGRLANEQLAAYLREYADPDRVVTVTEGNGVQTVSYYEPPAAPAVPVYAPVVPSYMSFGFGGCST